MRTRTMKLTRRILPIVCAIFWHCPHRSCGDTLPVITWVSSPVEPGQHALLAVVGMRNRSKIEVKQGTQGWQSVLYTGVTEYGCAIEVPRSFAAAPFTIRIDGGLPFTANVPSPWFAFGDQGNTSSSSGWVRVVGDAVNILPKATVPTATLPQLKLENGDATHVLSARNTTWSEGIGAKLSRWHAFFDLAGSKHITPGVYKVSLAGGRDGLEEPVSFVPLCTFETPDVPCLDTWTVTDSAPPVDHKSNADGLRVFTVNSTQPGPARNATDAVQRAIAAATANGGGIVYFPRGQYFINGPLVVCPGTYIHGAGADLVSIYFAEDNESTAPAAYVTSSSPGSWGLADVTLYITAFAKNIVRFLPGTNGAYLRRTRIRYNSYFCLEATTPSSSRGRTATWNHDVGVAVLLAGVNIFVTDNDIYSTGDVVSTQNNGDTSGGRYMHIARNTFWNGATTHWGISWKQTIYEDNVATGTSVTAMGSNYPQYAHNVGLPHVQNIYHHNNSQTMVWGNDREMMTCDNGGGVYYGAVLPAANARHSNETRQVPETLIHLNTSASAAQPGGAMCVLQGTGTGECRRVIKNPATNSKAVNLDPVIAASCASEASSWMLPDANGALLLKQNSTFALVVCCDSTCGNPIPPGAPCGSLPSAEALVIGIPDNWTLAHQTCNFSYSEVTQQIVLRKSQKCVGITTDSSQRLVLLDCNAAGARTRWAYNAQTEQFSLQGSSPKSCMAVETSVKPNLEIFSVDIPFTVPLDSTSRIAIFPYVGHIAFIANNYSDGGEVQFYAEALGCVAAENRFTRTGGLSVWARGFHGADANLRQQFIDNTVVEGNHVWNYNTKPNDPGEFPYFPGGSKTLEPWFFGALTNGQGMPIDPFIGPTGFMGAFDRFIVMRGNRVASNGGIVIKGTSANVLVEDNVIANSDVGIHVNYTTTQGGVVLVGNTEPPSVPPNYNPYVNE
eukprot:m.886641 g.886641  ORF g.886641 m.886641 type:complete len:955 (-) comp23627_c0_seq5:567-3431(-)